MKLSINRIENLWKESLLMKILLTWFFIDITFALIIFISTGEYQLLVFYLLWGIIFYVTYEYVRPKQFIVAGFVLAVVEETIVYYLGGGLQGKAVSLTHDYVNSLPIFLMMIIGWYFYQKKYSTTITALYLMAGLQGFFIEIILTGLYASPLYVLLFGGTTFLVYGGIMIVAFYPEEKTGLKPSTYLLNIVAWLIVFVLILIGAIIADNLNKLLGY